LESPYDREALWYKEAVIYEIHVRAFADGDGDGVGDFKGLTGRLDYLQKLGVTAVWLLPFYPSPLRDDGYDIADYASVHPAYGSLADFKRFLRKAHERGIRVITELVLNHTSDQHPWFERARRAKPGSVHRDFYVWSETPEKFRQARVIFGDFEQSNWSWDPAAKAYYWHRFYSHQPDLNFDNPAVRAAMFRVVDHWLSMGVDGLRLDAVPYLFERVGTNCENLPETHAFLKELRAYVDKSYPGRMLLAEANQWPEDAAGYFGDGDECHMAFHFPVMPRLFMALWMEDRHPVIDILEQTPAIPESCQWAIFLRNHDELTLEMVSDEERDYMYRAYARDAKSRINLGIRRRLAPLMQNNRRRMELINFLLFSFPATPIVYYGDELGMGDNYHLGDRNGVRTPMQWSPDRNAGFSTANPQSLFLPVIIDPEYHFEVVNVETAERNPSSFLWWMRRLIAAYKRLPALGRGDLRFVKLENTKVLSFLRSHGEDVLLVVVNLSRFAQVAELDLSDLAGMTPVEVFGQTRFPVIGEGPYLLSLGPHDHFWFKLASSRRPAGPSGDEDALCLFARRKGGQNGEPEAPADIPAELAGLLSGKACLLPRSALFGDITVVDRLSLESPDRQAMLVLVDCLRAPLPSESRVLLLARAAVTGPAGTPDGAPASLPGQASAEPGPVLDGFHDSAAIRAFSSYLGAKKGRSGSLAGFAREHFVPLGRRKDLISPPAQVRLIGNARHSMTYSAGNEVFLKIFLKPEEGRHPEVEILSLLNRRDFPGVPLLLSRLVHRRKEGEAATLALATTYVSGALEGTRYVSEALDRFFERVLAGARAATKPSRIDAFADLALAREHSELIGEYLLDFFSRLGQRTASLHQALRFAGTRDFSPEPFTKLYLRSLYQSMRNLTHRAAQGADRRRSSAGRKSEHPAKLPKRVLIERFQRLVRAVPGGLRIRIHGDFQLENVLHTGKDFMLVDFEGDAGLPLGERRIKRSVLRDVAGMIFSIVVVSEKTLRRHLTANPAQKGVLSSWHWLWLIAACQSFIRAYLKASGEADYLPRDEATLLLLLDVFLVEQALRAIVKAIEEDGGDLGTLMNILEALLRFFP
jgi:maltose alpha-D-glucosyltransferase / alpha-amylase